MNSINSEETTDNVPSHLALHCFAKMSSLGCRVTSFGRIFTSVGFKRLTKAILCFIGLPVPRRDFDDVDEVLSVSTRSIASSCSVASATLERARKRKEEFWGKGGIATR